MKQLDLENFECNIGLMIREAMAIYAKEDEDWTDKFFKRRMR